MKTILAIDQGTHASRALLFDQHGDILASSNSAVSINRKDHGVVEQDGTEILDTVREVIDNVLAESNAHVIAAALTTQRSTLVAWDNRTGIPLAPAISWQDRRCASALEDLVPYQSKIHQITGLPLSPHYLAGKIRWLLKHNEHVKQAYHHHELMMGSLSSFLCFNLLDNQPFLIDHSNASRSLLFDIAELDWHQELLQIFDVPGTILPACVPTLYDFGTLKDYDIPLSCVCGDQNAALHANGTPSTESLSINIGTGAFILQHQGENIKHHSRLLTSIANSSVSHTHYLLEGTINAAGSALSTLQKQWPNSDFQASLPNWLNEINEPPIHLNGTVGLGSPWWIDQLDNRFIPECDDMAKQAIAIIETIVFLLQHNIQQMDTSSTRAINISGGLSQLDGLCQKIADLTRLAVNRFENEEATARGAAWLVASLHNPWPVTQATEKFTPAYNPALEQRYTKYTDSLLATLGEKASWYQDDSLLLSKNPIIPRIVAHRGYQLCYPENTLESIMAAIKAGAHCIEVDIQFSQDSVPMLIHDESLLRTTGVEGNVFDYSLKELLEFNANEARRLGDAFNNISIPTLNELVNIIRKHQHIHFFIEIKRHTLEQFGTANVMTIILDMIKSHANNCTIISFNKDCLEYVKENSNISIGWVLREYDQAHLDNARQLKPDYLICNYKKLGEHTRPVAGPWQWMLYEINNTELADKLFASGVNYISSADIDTLTQVYKSKGSQ